MPAEVDAMQGNRSVTELVTRARNDDQQAWNALVKLYAPLIWSICRRYRLTGADAGDVGQSVWLHLVDHLDNLRDPSTLAGWLATTTRRECLRVLRTAQRSLAAASVIDAENIPDHRTGIAEEELLRAERYAALHEALTHLPPRCQLLIALLTADPPVPNAQISATLGIPIGSIGPTRSRCLTELRRYPAIAALINAEAASTESETLARPEANAHAPRQRQACAPPTSPSRPTPT